MSAAPAFAGPRRQPWKEPGGSAPIPHVVVHNLKHLIHAELMLLLIVARRTEEGEPGEISDAMWEEWTGCTPKTRQNAQRGLIEKKALKADGKGNLVGGRYELDARGFGGWARHADPNEKRTAGRGPSKPAAPKIHPDCAAGCAMAEGRAELIPLAATAIPKPVSATEISRSVSSNRRCEPNASPNTQGSSRVDPPGAHFSGDAFALHVPRPGKQLADRKAEVEAEWSTTLQAMRALFATVGVKLLMDLVAAVLALFPDATDQEIAHAVGVVVRERGSSMRGPALFLNAVPDVMANFRRIRGKPLAATQIAKPVSVEDQAERDLALADFDRWYDADPEKAKGLLDKWRGE